jgi:hypothetical protein
MIARAAATPRPWRVVTKPHGTWVVGADGYPVNAGTSPVDDANAELTVRAVNAHDELVTAVKDFLAATEACEGRPLSERVYQRAKINVRAAIAKAEGRQP